MSFFNINDNWGKSLCNAEQGDKNKPNSTITKNLKTYK